MDEAVEMWKKWIVEEWIVKIWKEVIVFTDPKKLRKCNKITLEAVVEVYEPHVNGESQI